MKRHIINYSIALVTVFVQIAVAGTNSILDIDGFEYNTVDQLEEEWTIRSSGFSGSVQILLNTNDVKEGKQSLELILPPTGEKSRGGLNLDFISKASIKETDQLRFWLFSDRWESISQMGIHFGDAGWKNYFVRFGLPKGTLSGWQEIVLSCNSDGMFPYGGKPNWDNAQHLRIALWFRSGVPAGRILVDEMVWDKQQKRPYVHLNKNWYDKR